jgi:Stigma-specific protein, Stig1
MNVRRLALLALLVLPACLDPIVSTQCATGYSACHGVCVAAGTCAAPDAAGGTPDAAVAGMDAAVDGQQGDVNKGVDGGVWETSAEAGTRAEVQVADTAPTDAPNIDTVDAPTIEDLPVQDDLPIQDDLPVQDDLPIQNDAPMLDDTGTPPNLAIDGAVDQGEAIEAAGPEGGMPCLDCVDAGDSEGGNADDGGASAVDGALVCVDPLAICNGQCVDPSLDPANCGTCNNLCDFGVCNDGICLDCTAEGAVCGRQCADLARDPDNCGFCGNPCASGLCNSGQCEAAGTGRAIVIGHDYLRNRAAMNRILGNAVFLWPVNPVRLLVYEGAANPTAIAGADTAIAQVANATGRQAVRTAAAASDVPALLAATDVFLIYGQELANDTTLTQLGSDWSAALLTFMSGGGTVVLLDGVYTGNSGTCQILAQPGLFQLTRAAATTGDVCTVVARGDALTTGLPRTYLCEQNSTSFNVTDLSNNITVVVQDVDKTVVVHKLF